MNVATKVVGALVLIVILISAMFGVANDLIKDSGQKGQDAGNNRTALLGCVSRNSHRDNPRSWCQRNMDYNSERGELVSA